MYGESENADTNQHNECREQYRLAILRKDRLACTMLIEQTFDDEDGIIIPLAEDKGRQNDIHDVKL